MANEEKTVMIVDDSVYLINKLKTMLEKNGFRAIGVTDGKQALEKFPDLRPDLVTIDIVMPNMGGIEVFTELKKIDPKVKVIIVSSIAMKEKIMAAVKLGAKNFIIKPFSEQKLMEIVNRVLGVAQ